MVNCLSVAIIYTKSIFYKISNLYSYDKTYDKAFAEKRTLKSHFITHTGDKPYSCSFYVQAFKMNDIENSKYCNLINAATLVRLFHIIITL